MFKKIVILTSFLLFILSASNIFQWKRSNANRKKLWWKSDARWHFYSSWQVKEVTYGGVKYRCVGCGSCTPISGGSSTYTPSNRLSPSQQATIGIMGSFLSGFLVPSLVECLMTRIMMLRNRENMKNNRENLQRKKRNRKNRKNNFCLNITS